MDAKDIILGVIGFGISFYGGINQNLFTVVTGILIIFLTMWLKLQDQEEDVGILKAQINTQSELKRIWREIDEIKDHGIKKWKK